MLDTTGSMGPLIEGAKRKIWSIATTIVDTNPDAEIRMGLVAYRDIGDEYVTKTFNLTTDIQDLYANLLELKARGGGDWPESVNEALHVGVTKLSWTQGPEVRRIMFLVGDAPPHMDYAQDTKYPEVMRMARERGITVNAVQAGGARDTERVWREIAQMRRRRATSRSRRTAARSSIIETPYDIEIIELQGRINGTVIPYGPRAAALQRRAEDRARSPRLRPPVASEMAGYLNKRSASSGGEAVTGRATSSTDVTAGRQKLDSVKDDDLPDCAARHEAGRAPVRDRQATWSTRKVLNERMAELVKKRDQYVLDQRKNASAQARRFVRPGG